MRVESDILAAERVSSLGESLGEASAPFDSGRRTNGFNRLRRCLRRCRPLRVRRVLAAKRRLALLLPGGPPARRERGSACGAAASNLRERVIHRN